MRAAIGRKQYALLPQWHQERTRNAAALAASLSNIPGLRVPLPPVGAEHAYYRLNAYVDGDSLQKDGLATASCRKWTAGGVCRRSAVPAVDLPRASLRSLADVAPPEPAGGESDEPGKPGLPRSPRPDRRLDQRRWPTPLPMSSRRKQWEHQMPSKEQQQARPLSAQLARMATDVVILTVAFLGGLCVDYYWRTHFTDSTVPPLHLDFPLCPGNLDVAPAIGLIVFTASGFYSRGRSTEVDTRHSSSPRRRCSLSWATAPSPTGSRCDRFPTRPRHRIRRGHRARRTSRRPLVLLSVEELALASGQASDWQTRAHRTAAKPTGCS